jgi:hypothetical protein
MFVPAVKDDSAFRLRRKACSHVMREVMRPKRWQRDETRGQTTDGGNGYGFVEAARSSVSTLSSADVEEADSSPENAAPAKGPLILSGARCCSTAIINDEGRNLLELLPREMTRRDIELAD